MDDTTVREIVGEFERGSTKLSCELIEFINDLSDEDFCQLLLAERKYAIKFLQLREEDLYESNARDSKELDERLVRSTGPVILSLYENAERLDQTDILLLAGHRIPPVIGPYSIFDYVDASQRRDCAITYYESFYPLYLRKSGTRRPSALPKNLEETLAKFMVEGEFNRDDDAKGNLKLFCAERLFGEYIPFSNVLSGNYIEWIEKGLSPFLECLLGYVLHNLKKFLKKEGSTLFVDIDESYPNSVEFIKQNFPRTRPEQSREFCLWRAFYALSDGAVLKRMFDHDRWSLVVKESCEPLFEGLRNVRDDMVKLFKEGGRNALLMKQTIHFLDAFQIAYSVSLVVGKKKRQQQHWDEFARESFCVLFPLFTKCPELRNIFKMLELEEEKRTWRKDLFSAELITTDRAVRLFNNSNTESSCKCSFIKTRSVYENRQCACFTDDDSEEN